MTGSCAGEYAVAKFSLALRVAQGLTQTSDKIGEAVPTADTPLIVYATRAHELKLNVKLLEGSVVQAKSIFYESGRRSKLRYFKEH